MARPWIAASGALLLLVMAGCANSINMHNAQRYAVAGQAAVRNGAWAEARKNFGLAIANVRMGHGDDRTRAVLYYEYGRASGVICDWPEAERGLNEAYNLDQQISGPAYMSLVELARMNLIEGGMTRRLNISSE